MNKVLALGVSSLLLLGAASQASASFEANHWTMSVYDAANDKEMGIDLGLIADLSAQNVTLKSGLSFTGFDFTASTSGIGIFTDMSNPTAWYHEGYFATSNNSGTASISGTFANAQAFTSAEGSVRTYGYAANDGNNDGVALIAASFANSYLSYFNVSTNGGYAGLQMVAGQEAEFPTAGGYVDMYIYQFATDATYTPVQVGDSYQAIIRLYDTGSIILNPTATSEVPVPGAVWLLGSGLAGLIGIRRRKNS